MFEIVRFNAKLQKLTVKVLTVSKIFRVDAEVAIVVGVPKTELPDHRNKQVDINFVEGTKQTTFGH